MIECCTNPMAYAIVSLESEGKRVLAITTEYVLCYWKEDDSYVSWSYQCEPANLRMSTVYGNYMSAKYNTEQEAIEAFTKRINNEDD